MIVERFKTYNEFYRFYLSEHKNRTCRLLHFIGTFLVFFIAAVALYLDRSYLWIFVPFAGYGFAWVGHYFFERNQPATFKYPLWSFISDFRMFFEFLTGKIGLDATKDPL